MGLALGMFLVVPWFQGVLAAPIVGKKVWAYGGHYTYSLLTNVPAGLTNVVAVAAGSCHNLALRSNGAVVAWGEEYSESTNVPPGLGNVIAITAGDCHSCALTGEGRVVCWGDNSYGQTNVPTGLSNVVAVAAGGQHSLALRKDGTVVGWGLGVTNCSCSNGEYGQANPPANLTGVAAIAGGAYFSVAMKSNGTVVAWGYYRSGETEVPPNLTNAIAIAAGDHHTLALTTQRTLVTWGAADSFYNRGQTNIPAGMSNIVAISARGAHSLVLRSDGRVFSWGLDQQDYLGVQYTPKNLSNVVAIAAGSDQNLAVALNTGPDALPQQLNSHDNSDSLIQLRGTDPENDSLNFSLTGLPAQGTLYQVAGDTRGAMITSVPALVTDPVGRVIFVPPTNALGYFSFQFVADDGQYRSAPATVEVRVIGAPFAITRRPTFTDVTTAQLNGAVTPNGHSTAVWFEWGLDSSFGSRSAATAVGAGRAVQFLQFPFPGV
ncbi:MAG: hypothetical protein JWM16_4060, partial [Verrucomicrobiales bacterium]|nr:hypothetical protein [Verrucomicrobiales bacterium]